MTYQTVETVLGPISTAQLGPTLSHEHVFGAATGYESDSTLHFDHEENFLKVTQDLESLKSMGVMSIVDPIPMDLGRRVEFMADVSTASGVNVICATGLYVETGPLAGFPTYYKIRRLEELEAIFCKEIKDGIGARKIKPGVIKCATSAHEITENETKALRAAARASKATGTPITTHTQQASMGIEQLTIFEEEGVSPHRVTIGHCSDSSDLAYLAEIAKRGAYIGFDRIGNERMITDDVKVGVLAGLLAMGLEKQIVLSHDAVGCSYGFPETPSTGKRSYTYIHQEFIPALKAAGIDNRCMDMMLTENPRRYFEGTAP